MNFKELIPDYSGNINDLQLNSISINSQDITNGDLYISLAKNITNQKIRDKVLFSESYCVNDFVKDYNSFKGNAYGLANTLFQTAFLRPKMKSKKVDGLFFTGQLTVPGPGVPPAIISGKIVSKLIL